MTLIQKRRNGNGSLFPSSRNDFMTNRFFTPGWFDLDDFWNTGSNILPANISETDKEIRLDLCAPGLKKDDFKIHSENGVLTISSEKEEESKQEDKRYTRREFSYSGFSRSFQLPENIDEDHINAKYENGMLRLTIPKKETAAPAPKKQITID